MQFQGPTQNQLFLGGNEVREKRKFKRKAHATDVRGLTYVRLHCKILNHISTAFSGWTTHQEEKKKARGGDFKCSCGSEARVHAKRNDTNYDESLDRDKLLHHITVRSVYFVFVERSHLLLYLSEMTARSWSQQLYMWNSITSFWQSHITEEALPMRCVWQEVCW